MSRLPGVGTVSYTYEGITFSFPTPHNSRLSCEPILDHSGRTIRYTRFTLVIDCIVTADDFASANAGVTLAAGASLDSAFTVLRKTLNQKSGTLVYSGQGLGTDSYVTISPSNDLEFGPHARILNWQQLASNRAIALTWEVSWCVNHCLTTLNPFGIQNLGQFSYDVTHDIASNGRCTRTISGIAEVVVRKNGQTITYTADAIREALEFPLLPGFHRVQQWPLSTDRRFLHFTITDTEINSHYAFFPGVHNANVHMDVSGDLAAAMGGMWHVTFTGNIDVLPNVHKSVAWRAMLVIIQSRLKHLDKGKFILRKKKKPTALEILGNKILKAGNWLGLVDDSDANDLPEYETLTQQKISPILSRINITENIFGLDTSFVIGYRFATNLQYILAASGLWQNVPGSWSKWTAKLGEVCKPTGFAGLKHVAGDDVLIDFCHPGNPILASSIKDPKSPGDTSESTATEPASDVLAYQNGIESYNTSNVSRHTKIGEGDAYNDGNKPSSASTASSKFQNRGGGSYGLRMSGYAFTINQPAATPTIEKIGSETPICNTSRVLTPKIVGFLLDSPIYLTAWDKAYYVPNGRSKTIEVNAPETS